MNLGQLIHRLQAADHDKVCRLGFHNPHSYRGYYEDLALEPCQDVSVRDMLTSALEARGRIYFGWKGGEYPMDDTTEVWLARPGGLGETLGPYLLSFMLGELP